MKKQFKVVMSVEVFVEAESAEEALILGTEVFEDQDLTDIAEYTTEEVE